MVMSSKVALAAASARTRAHRSSGLGCCADCLRASHTAAHLEPVNLFEPLWVPIEQRYRRHRNLERGPHHPGDVREALFGRGIEKVQLLDRATPLLLEIRWQEVHLAEGLGSHVSGPQSCRRAGMARTAVAIAAAHAEELSGVTLRSSAANDPRNVAWPNIRSRGPVIRPQ